MSNPPLIRRVRQGQPVSASQWNRIGSAIRELSTQPSAGQAVIDRAAQRVMLAEIHTLATSSPWEFKVRLVDEDAGDGWDVVPPWVFYQASRGSVTYTYTDQNTRTANPGAETQLMTPSYAVGDRLLVINVGGILYDLNVDGRMWAQDPTP